MCSGCQAAVLLSLRGHLLVQMDATKAYAMLQAVCWSMQACSHDCLQKCTAGGCGALEQQVIGFCTMKLCDICQEHGSGRVSLSFMALVQL